MISTFKQNNVTWIDLENPTKEEVREMMNTYSLDPEVAEDLLDPTIRTRADVFKDYSYFVLHFPIHTHLKDKIFDKRSEELDFIIGRNFLITIHYAPIDAIVSFAKSFETDTLLKNNEVTKDSGSLFVHILYKMYKAVQDKIEDVETTLATYEEDIFAGKEKSMVFKLSEINRVLIYFKQVLHSHDDTLKLFKQVGLEMFGEEFKNHFVHIIHEYNKASQTAISAKQYASELRITNDSLLSTKQNEIMKTLTVVNFIILPLSVITGLFGMNTVGTPVIGESYDFWIIVLAMFVITVTSTSIFKKKNWL